MRSTLRSSYLAMGLAVALVATIVIALGIAVWEGRQREMANWRTQLSNLTQILAQETSQEVTSAYLILDSISASVSSANVRDAEDFQRKMGSEAMYLSMRDKKQPVPQIDVAAIIDANGKVINSTRSFPAPDVTVADRDYFRAQQRDPALGVYISTPVRNRATGQWSFVLSRRLSGAHGEFLGLAVVGLSCEVLGEQFRKIELGPDTVVSLTRSDGLLVARWPYQEESMGQRISLGPEARAYGPVEQLGEVLVQTWRSRSEEGRTSFVLSAEKRVEPYPLSMSLSVTDNVFLAQWRHSSMILGGVALFSIGAIFIAFFVLVKALLRRDLAIDASLRLREDAEAANRAKSDFLAMMSHEIRTPLTSIMGYAELLSNPGNVAVKEDAARVIVRNGQHLLGIINDILDISKIEADHLTVERVPFSPIETVWGLDSVMSTQARNKNISFDMHIEYPFPSQLVGDPTRWKQVIFNLCSNAIKFTEAGSVMLTVWYDAAGTRLMCNVVDTGIGISEEQKQKLFAPFVQADRSVARRFGGTGLGLYLVRRLAVAMGGDVQLASEPGQGSVFEVSVQAPLAPDTQWLSQAPDWPDDEDRPSLQGALAGKILLVEDGPDNRQLIGALLAGLGLDVVFAENGEQGVEKALSEDIDVILMDIQMPVMDGMRATELIRAAGHAGPIVALTANVMTEDVRRYLSGGFSHVLAKPLVRDQFEGLLGTLCGRRDAAAAAPASSTMASLQEYRAIQRSFAESLPERLERIQAHAESGQWQDVSHLAHMLKGTAGSFGFTRSGEVAHVLERAIRGHDEAAARAAVASLAPVIEQELKDYRGGAS